MIRYPIHPAQLEARVEQHRPGWLARAAERTERFREAGKYGESSSIWTEIKRPYMELQGFKCGFCERRLEKSAYGNIEHDVEHPLSLRRFARLLQNRASLKEHATHRFRAPVEVLPGGGHQGVGGARVGGHLSQGG